MKPRFLDLQRASLAVNVLLVLLCTLLISQNRALKSARSPAPGPAALKPGDHVEGFSYRTLAGEIRRLDYSETGSRNLLFVISTSCPFCQKSLPNIQRLFDENRNGACRILVVSIHELALTMKFAADHHVGFPLVATAGEEFAHEYRISGVPTTILVSGGGVVEKVWEGELTDGLSTEIEGALAQRSSLPRTSTL